MPFSREQAAQDGSGHVNRDTNGTSTNTNSNDTKGGSGTGGGKKPNIYVPGPAANLNYHENENGSYTGIKLSNSGLEKIANEFKYEPEGFIEDGWLKEELSFQLPDYGYDRHLMDIRNWQKQLVSYGAEPGWFFFKIFFNFSTNYGLLGGIMNTIGLIRPDGVSKEKWVREMYPEYDNYSEHEQDRIIRSIMSSMSDKSKYMSINTAYGYLDTVCTLHKYERIYERMLALVKFAGALKDISLRTPWIFRSISGLNTINQTYTEELDKDKSFVIGLGEETLDQRIGTLLDLYKFAAFDQINCKEIIPANLRKFETTIMVYHMPLKYQHTKVAVDKQYASKGNGVLPSAMTTTNSSAEKGGFDNMMSFKMYTFLNCEIDTETLGEYYVDGVSNETPFQLGKNGLKIKYDRVYEHRMNEWNEMFFGSDGFYYNNDFDMNSNINSNISGKIKESLNLEHPDNSLYRLRMKAIKAHKDWQFSIAEYTDLLLGKYYGLGYHMRMGMGDLIHGVQNGWNQFTDRLNGIKDRWRMTGSALTNFATTP